jgi:hypothetical protein
MSSVTIASRPTGNCDFIRNINSIKGLTYNYYYGMEDYRLLGVLKRTRAESDMALVSTPA